MAEKKGGSKKIDRKSIKVAPEKTANWPGLPGKKQPRERGEGAPKIKTSMVQDY